MSPVLTQGAQLGVPERGILAPAVGMLVVLAAAARTTLCAFGRGAVSLAAAVRGPWNRP